MKPTIGRIVHYVLANGQHRAATVTNAFGGTAANLTVHLDGSNDLQGPYHVIGDVREPNPNALRAKPEVAVGIPASTWLPGVLIVGSAAQDEDTQAPGTWHWPERE